MTPEVRAVLAARDRVTREAPGRKPREVDQLVEELLRTVQVAMRQPAALAELVKMLRTTSDVGLRSFLRDVLPPQPSVAYSDPDLFRAHPLVRFTAEEMPIKQCLVLIDLLTSTDDDPFEDPDEPGNLSWLAGRPAGDGTVEWPRDRDGLPLAHVAQVDLGYVAGDLGTADPILDRLGLPDVGVLQLFHDRQTYGNLEDDGDRAWVVRWLQRPTELLAKPEDLEKELFRDPAAVRVMPAISVPPALMFQGSGKEWDRYQTIVEHIEFDLRSPRSLDEPGLDPRPTVWEKKFVGEEPTSRIGGYGNNERTEDITETLTAKLPLDPGDQYFLLFDISGTRHLEDWFHDSGHLQVWIRESDLRRRAFDQVWCLTITG